MDNEAHISLLVQDRSYLSIYRKEVHKLTTDNEFSAKKIAEIDIIVAEILSNLVKHAGGGELLVKISGEEGDKMLELVSIDAGRGMADPAKMMQDGVSTTKTMGGGLGAIKRLSDIFQLYSIKDWGTILLARVYMKEPKASAMSKLPSLGAIVVPKPGEVACGDGFYHRLTADHWKIFIGDGLGHGVEASAAVKAAVAAFRTCVSNDPVEIIRDMHVVVKRTRGLVGTVAVYSFKEKKWWVCGVGNIATNFLNAMTLKNYMAYNGVIGMNIPNTMTSQEIPHAHSQTFIMCSDGIRTRWDIQKYPMIIKYDPTIIAAAIYKDFARKTDDMSVVVGRIN